MNGKKAKVLRRTVTGDPDLAGKLFHHRRVIASDMITRQEIIDPKAAKTLFHHPHSRRAQYKQAKKEVRSCQR